MNKTHLSKRHPSIGLMIALLLFSMLVAACGGTTTPAQNAQPAPAEEEQPQEQEQVQETTTEEATDTNVPPSESATPKGTLRYGYGIDIGAWDPHQANDNSVMCYYQMVYDSLLSEDADGNLIPGLATDWQQTTEAITFTLRENVVFHDGNPFNADVARANLLRVRDSQYPSAAQLRAVDSVDILDDTHIRINLSQPDIALLTHLSRYAGMMISPALIDMDEDITTFIGTGPWKLNTEETEPTVRYVFDLFSDFWDPSVQGVERVEIILLPEPTSRVNALKSEQVDAAWIPWGDADMLEAEGYTVLHTVSNVFGLHIFDREGTMVPAFADERVRLALSYAIDRELFAETVFNGYAIPLTQRFLPGEYGYAENIADLSYNPEKAKQLLAEAGVENLEFQVPSVVHIDKSNQALAGFFADVGVTMNIQSIVLEALFSETAQGKWAATLLPITERHVSSYVENRVLSGGFLNPFDIVDEDLEDLVAQAKQLPADEAKPIWAEVMRETSERGIIIPIAAIEYPVAISPKVKGGHSGYFMPGVLLMRGVTIEE